MSRNVKELEEKIGYNFKDSHLLRHAVTHSSYVNEKHMKKADCNERLEFLGDAVLELISSEYLFFENQTMPEGELTKLRASMVCEKALAFCARDLELGSYLLLGKGEDATGGRFRESITSDALEALADKENSIHGLNLMLVEDNELNAEVAEILLEDEGAIITMVNDGQQAVELFNNNPVGTFDAILMDIMMPVMDGLTATKAIRALNRPDAGIIPIIAMTANAFAEDVQRCLDAGMNAHLAKPLDIEKVKKTICEHTIELYNKE